MLTTFWSVKGGVGTTVVAATFAAALSREAADGAGVLVVDLAGDMPAALARPDPGDPGLTAWTGADPDVAGDALARLELHVVPGLTLLPRGSGPFGPPERLEVLARLLASDPRDVVVDAGVVLPGSPLLPLLAVAHRSRLVLRPCYLGLQRARSLPAQPSDVVLVRDEGRRLSRRDVEHAVGSPVRAEVAVDAGTARAIDAGELVRRPPRPLARALRRAA